MKKCILTVAPTMTDETYALLCEKAKSKTGADVEFVRKNDDGVIAGFVMEYCGEVTDLSVGTQLGMLESYLTSREGNA